MQKRPADNGIILAALVLVIAFAAVTVFSSTILVVQYASRSDAAHKRLKCLYAAFAGLSDAAYSCRSRGNWQSGIELPEKTYIDDEDKVFFQLRREQADMLLLDARSAVAGEGGTLLSGLLGSITNYGIIEKLKISALDSNKGEILAGLIRNGLVEVISTTDVRLKENLYGKENIVREIAKDKFEQIWAILQQAVTSYRVNTISGITLYNAGVPASMKIAGVDLYWTPGIRLRRIVMGGRTVWIGRRSSPASCSILFPVQVSSSGTPIDALQFDGDARAMELKAVFRMSDGSSAEKYLYPASGKVILDLRSQGGIEGGSVSRILTAEYDLVSGELSAAQEVEDAP